MQGPLDMLHMVTNPTVPRWDLGRTMVLVPVTSQLMYIFRYILCTSGNYSHKVTDGWDVLLS
jgi:hypothetical protein